jgi:hypothetical protein
MLYAFDPLWHVMSQPMVWRELNPFRYFRCTARVKFIVTGNAFMGGKIIAAWIPPNRVNFYYDGWYSLTQISGVPQKVEIYPTENATYEIEIPLLLSKRYMDLNDFTTAYPSYFSFCDNTPTLGLVALWVVSQLVSEDAVDSSQISIFVTLENFVLDTAFSSELDTTTPPPSANNAVLPNYLPFSTKFANNISKIQSPNTGPVLNSSESEAKQKESTGWISGPLTSISKMAQIFTPFTGTYAPLVAAGSAASSSLASVFKFFNLDKPRMQTLPTQVIKNFRNMANSDGIDQANHIGLSANNAVSPVGANQPFDEEHLHISRLASIPQTIATAQVTTASAVSSVPLSWAVAPWNVPVLGLRAVTGSTTVGAAAYAPTFASWVTTPFKYWRGTCVVEVEVVAQGFAKLALGLSWVPGDKEYATNPTTVPTGIEAETRTQIVQVSGNQRIKYEIPFKAATHWLRADRDYQFPISPNSLPRNTTGRINGHFYCYIVNQLTSFSPNGTNNNPVTLLLHVSFPDLQVAQPIGYQMSSDRGAIYAIDANPELNIVAGRDEELFQQSVLNSSESVVLSQHHWFGDTITNILQLARRVSPLGFFSMKGNNATYAFSLFSTSPRIARVGSLEPLDSRPSQTISDNTNFALWFSNIYLTWRGEVSYQIIGNGSNFSVTGSSNPTDVLGITIANTDAWNTSNYPQISVLEEEPFVNSTGSYLYPNGAFHKPDSLSDQPAVVSVPYYSEMTFQHTIDPGNRLVDTAPAGAITTIVPFTRGSVPGIRAYVTSSQPTPTSGTNHYAIECLCNVSDNFSYGGLYPPPVFTDAYNLPAATVDNPVYLNAMPGGAGPPAWIFTLP